MNPNEITSAIIRASIEIHEDLGPGLLESVYVSILAHVLRQNGLRVECQPPVAIRYKGLVFPDPFRIDLLVEGRVIVELKSVEEVMPVHFRQTLTYLRLSGLHLGLLINFNVSKLKDGIHRIVDRLPE
jgi:GxxExxY protein